MRRVLGVLMLAAALTGAAAPAAAEDEGETWGRWVEAAYKDTLIPGAMSALADDATNHTMQEVLRTIVSDTRERVAAIVPTSCFLDQYLAFWSSLEMLDLMVDLTVAGDATGAKMAIERFGVLSKVASDVDQMQDCMV